MNEIIKLICNNCGEPTIYAPLLKIKSWEIHIDKSRSRANKLCVNCAGVRGGTQYPGELALFEMGISENKLVSTLRVWICEECEDITHRRVGR